MARKATRTSHALAMERLADAVESLDEVQALLAGEPEASEFWIGIIFSAQTSLQLVAEMAREAEKDAARASRRRKPAARKRR